MFFEEIVERQRRSRGEGLGAQFTVAIDGYEKGVVRIYCLSKDIVDIAAVIQLAQIGRGTSYHADCNNVIAGGDIDAGLDTDSCVTVARHVVDEGWITQRSISVAVCIAGERRAAIGVVAVTAGIVEERVKADCAVTGASYVVLKGGRSNGCVEANGGVAKKGERFQCPCFARQQCCLKALRRQCRTVLSAVLARSSQRRHLCRTCHP
jgi:hypothetical protein